MAGSSTGTDETSDKTDESALRDMTCGPGTVPTVVGVTMDDESVIHRSRKKVDFGESDRLDMEASGRSSSENRRESTSESSDSEEGAVLVGLKETKNVNRSKLLVYLVLLFAALTVGFATYYFLDKEEEKAFEQSVSR
jgi:hypothetical protein